MHEHAGPACKPRSASFRIFELARNLPGAAEGHLEGVSDSHDFPRTRPILTYPLLSALLSLRADTLKMVRAAVLAACLLALVAGASTAAAART